MLLRGKPPCSRCSQMNKRSNAEAAAETRKLKYLEMYKNLPKGFSLVGEFVDTVTEVLHKCSKHGLVSQSPRYVAHSLKIGRPLCKRCTIDGRNEKNKLNAIKGGAARRKKSKGS